LRRSILISFLSVILCIAAKAQPYTQTFSLRYRSVWLKGDGTKGPYRLPDGFLLKGTEHISVGGEPKLRKKDYTIDYGRGEIQFFSPIPQGEIIRVEYERLPLTLKHRYFHRELVRKGSSPPKIKELRVDEPLPSPLSLQVRGSKSLRVSMGTERDLTFNQSLRLNITGQLTPDVTVTAILSDESLPFQSSGTTQNLSALDRLLVEVRGPSLSASLGDFDLPGDKGRFSSPERKLQGIKASANLTSGHFLLAGAISRGKFTVNRFLGEEGKQGPYKLHGQSKEGQISVLAGTERVWLNGIPLKRGDDRDYTIDYQEASLSFTPQRIIGSTSVIVVEFQYALRDYQRSFYIGQGSWNWEKKLRLFSSLLKEADDRQDPLSFSLGEREKEVLRKAGDNPDSAWIDGAKFLGEGKGDYTQLFDSLSNRYFLWVGADSGSHQVSFSWVGPGKGSYIRTEEGHYRYVYPGDGNYSPRIFLPLPQSHLYSNWGFTAQPDSLINLSGEVALSREDRNLFSPTNDEDNLGRALALSGRLGLHHQSLGRFTLPWLSLKGDYEDRQPNFSPLRGGEERDYRSGWGLDPHPQDRLLRTWNLSANLSPLRGLTLFSGTGKLYTKQGLSSLRKSYGGKFQGFKVLSLSYHLRQAHTTGPHSLQGGKATRDETQGNLSLGKATVGLGYMRDRGKREDKDFHTEEKRASLSCQGWGLLFLSANLVERAVYTSQYPSEIPGISHTWQTQIGLTEWRDWDGHLTYSRRRGPGTSQDLARIELGYHRPGWEGKIHYQANSIYSSNLVKTYLQVGEGEGDYRKEGENWIPDEEGDYLMVTEEIGEAHPSSRLEGDLALTAEPKPYLRSQTQLRWEEEVKEGRRVLPSSGCQGEYGKISLQEEVSLFPYSPQGSLTLRYSLHKLLDGRFGGGMEEESEEDKRVTLLYKLSPDLSLKLSFSAGRKRREMGGLSQYNVHLYRLGSESSLRLNQALIISLSGGYEWDYNSTSQVKARMLSLSPKVTRSFRQRGKIALEFGWEQVTPSPPGATLSWAMAAGEKPGDTIHWTATFSYKLSNLLTAELNYRTKYDPLWGWRRQGRMEVRALF